MKCGVQIMNITLLYLLSCRKNCQNINLSSLIQFLMSISENIVNSTATSQDKQNYMDCLIIKKIWEDVAFQSGKIMLLR